MLQFYIHIPGTGNVVPTTSTGRWFCIGYVLIGIPLLSLFFGMTGYYLTQLLRLAILKVGRENKIIYIDNLTPRQIYELSELLLLFQTEIIIWK